MPIVLNKKTNLLRFADVGDKLGPDEEQKFYPRGMDFGYDKAEFKEVLRVAERLFEEADKMR